MSTLLQILIVMAVAANPVGEVRAALPLALFVYDMSWAEAFTWAWLGSLASIPLAYWVYGALERWARHSPRTAAWLDRTYERTRKNSSRRVELAKEFAVFSFIAIPLPGTGTWTGVLMAHVFGFRFRKVFPFLYAGATVAIFVTLLVLSAFKLA